MSIRTIVFEAQMYVFKPEWAVRFALRDEHRDHSGMIAGQNFKIWVHFPNQLKVLEIPGKIESSTIFAGLPTVMYICDGINQFEFVEANSKPIISPAPKRFEDLNTSLGLPELLLLNRLLLDRTMIALQNVESKSAKEYSFEYNNLLYCYIVPANGFLPMKMSGFKGLNEQVMRRIVEFDFLNWEVNVDLP